MRLAGNFRFVLGLTALAGLAFFNACSSDSASPTGDGGGGPGGSSTTLHGSSSTLQPSGPGGSGGGGGEVLGLTFWGAKTGVAHGESEIEVTWEAATEPAMKPAQFVYRVYVAETSGGQDLTKPTLTTAGGALSTKISMLDPGTDYFVIVHAVDADGLEDDNIAEVKVTTADHVAPTFDGATTFVATNGTTARITWAAATDDATPQDHLVYDVFLTKNQGAEDFAHPHVTTPAGATSATLTGLDDSTTYYAVVRARDAQGNSDTNLVELSAVMPDGTPPTFGGVQIAVANGTSIDLTWSPANDDKSPQAAIVYDIYQATRPGTENFSAPTYTTVPGATKYTAIGLDVLTNYFFVVRARDEAGNDDKNVAERFAGTAARSDVEPPVFGGITGAVGDSDTSITISWAPATDDKSAQDAIVYDIFMGPGTGQENLAVPTYASAPGATSFQVTNLIPNTPYYFVVRARDELGNEDTGNAELGASTLKDLIKPAFGDAVVVTTLSDQAQQLDWTAATDDVSDPSKIVYTVFQGTSAGGEDLGTPVATVTGGTTATVQGLVPNTKYYYAVVATDEAGNGAKNPSEGVGQTLPDTTRPVFTGASGFDPTSATSATLSWGPATDDVTVAANMRYALYFSTTAGGEPATPTFTTAPGAAAYTFTGLKPKTKYFAYALAEDEAGNLSKPPVELTVLTPPDTTPPTFGGATGITNTNDNSVTVVWTQATDDVTAQAGISYDVCQSTTPGTCQTSFTIHGTVTGAGSFKDTGLTPNKNYYYVVRAKDAVGNEDANTIQVVGLTSSDATPPTFAGLSSATATSDQTIQLTWPIATDNLSSATQITYQIYVSTSPGGENFSTPTASIAGLAGPTNSYVYTAKTPGQIYYFVVRATDGTANQQTTPNVEKSATMQADAVAPTFSGITGVAAQSDQSLKLTWSAGSDDITPSASLVYSGCCTTGSSCVPTFAAGTTTGAGATSIIITGLVPLNVTNQTYTCQVRARDAAGNKDANNATRTGQTSNDASAPSWTFPSVSVSLPTPNNFTNTTRLVVSWSNSAVDDYTTSGNMRYYVSGTGTNTYYSGSTNSITVTGLTQNAAYTYYVYAVDQAGNFSTGFSAGNTTYASFSAVLLPYFNATDNVPTGSPGCKSCHAWTYANTVNAAPGYCGTKIINPNSPATSELYQAISSSGCTGDRMPYGGPYISNLTPIFNWISQGAVNN